MAAATALAGELHLRVDDAVVIHNSNKLALRLSPCGVFARVALVGQEVAALEVELALRLAGTASPVAALEPRVEPRVYERDGFAVTLWTYYEVVAPDLDLPGAYADVLQRLHTGMRSVEIATPHFLDRAAEAERLVTHRDETPALAEADRHLLLSTLQSARERIHSRGAAEQLLHGEPLPGAGTSAMNSRMGTSTAETSCPCSARVRRGPHSVLSPVSSGTHSHAAM